MNVLLVAPFFDDLPLLASEVETLVNTLQPRRVLQGDVSEGRLAATIAADTQEDGPFDGFWIATHSSERSVQLSDAAITRDALVSYIALSGAAWVVLNGCESEGLVAGITAIGCEVVAAGMTEDGSGIPDRDAWRLVLPLATALQQHGGSLREAFESIPSAGRMHRYFPPGTAQRALSDNDQRLIVLIYEVKAELAAMRGRVDAIDEKLSVMSAEMKERPSWAAVITYLVVVGFVTLFAALVLHQLYERGML